MWGYIHPGLGVLRVVVRLGAEALAGGGVLRDRHSAEHTGGPLRYLGWTGAGAGDATSGKRVSYRVGGC